MCDTRKVVPYAEASLQNLDAGTLIAYPLPEGPPAYAYYAVPSFLVIGAQKCGTGSLRSWLNMHPNLRGPIDECHFFDDVIDIASEWRRYVINPSFLISKNTTQFVSDIVHTFEKTPAYFDKYNRDSSVPELVHRMMPSGKFIVLLRNPTQRAYSSYQMGRISQKVFGPMPEYQKQDFLSLIQERISTPLRAQERLLTIGHYAAHLERWFTYFPREQFLILCLEDFQCDPFAVMVQLETFLDLAHFDYGSIAQKNTRGWWELKGQQSSGISFAYDPMPTEAKYLLDEYYAPWNTRLRQLLPALDFPW